MHFGLYLKNKELISAEQLVAAAAIQLSTLTRIGQLALEEGIVSAQDVFDVLRAQREAPNQRFGELAIEMGLMTHDELRRLLMLQADRKRAIAEILIAQGVLSEQQVAREMIEYRQTLGKRRVGNVTPSKIAPRGGGRAGRRERNSCRRCSHPQERGRWARTAALSYGLQPAARARGLCPNPSKVTCSRCGLQSVNKSRVSRRDGVWLRSITRRWFCSILRPGWAGFGWRPRCVGG